MDTLLSTLKQQAEAARADALPLYRELLERNATPEPGDGEALKEVIRTLGISLDDVASDLQAIARDRDIRARLLTEKTLGRLVKERDRSTLGFTEWLRARLVEAAKATPGSSIVLTRCIEGMVREQIATLPIPWGGLRTRWHVPAFVDQ